MFFLTLHQVRQFIRDTLHPICANADQIEAETWLLLEHVLKRSQVDCLTNPNTPISPAEHESIQHLLKQRQQHRVPLQYLLNESWFYGHRFHVSPAVLIPRPETEHLVELALQYIIKTPHLQHVVDMGTGSGCIAISLAIALKQQDRPIRITATDICDKALAIATQNATTHHVTDVIEFKLTNSLSGIHAHSVDLLISNPPYIPYADASTLKPEVHDHEPHLALFANDNGLALYKHIALEGQRILLDQAQVMVEMNDRPDDVVQVFFDAGYQNLEQHHDYSDRPRILSATYQRPSSK